MQIVAITFWIFLSLLVASGAQATPGALLFKLPSSNIAIGQFPYFSLQEAQLSCGLNSPCPKNIGLVHLIDLDNNGDKVVSQCTGFLVAENIVATSSHCVPKVVKKGKNSRFCNAILGIRFLEDGHKDTIYQCQKVISYSEEATSAPEGDFAFFEISHTGRKPIAIHKNGVKQDQILNYISIRPQGKEGGGTIVSERCRASLGTIYNPISATPFSKIISSSNCHVEQGNSGGPVLNENGEAVGIIQDRLSSMHIQGVLVSKNVANAPRVINSAAKFSNLSCIEDPVTKMFDQENCTLAEDIFSDNCQIPPPSQKYVATQSATKPWKESLPKQFLYDYQVSHYLNDIHIKAIPRCVTRPLRTDSKEYENIYFRWHNSFILKEQQYVDSQLRIIPQVSYQADGFGAQVIHLDLESSDEDGSRIWRGTFRELFDAQNIWEYQNLDRLLGHSNSPIQIAYRECSEQDYAKESETNFVYASGELENYLTMLSLGNQAFTPHPACQL